VYLKVSFDTGDVLSSIILISRPLFRNAISRSRETTVA
jgi:hypothetical protein